MRHIKKWTIGAYALAIGSFLVLTSCENGNLFGKLHNRGSSDDTSTLLSQADLSFEERNYQEALARYESVLSRDPNNAQALYGASGAAIAAAGLDIATLINNVISQTSAASASVHDIGDLIAQSRVTIAPSDAGTNSLLAGINLDLLNNVIDKSVCRDKMIASGRSDGSVKKDGVDFLVNYGVRLLLRALVKALRSDFFDITRLGNSYSVTMKGDITTACSTTAAAYPTLLDAVKGVISAYIVFNRIVDNRGFGSSTLIGEFRTDVNSAVTQLLTKGGSGALPDACIDALDAGGVNVNTFTNNTEAFEPPSNPC